MKLFFESKIDDLKDFLEIYKCQMLVRRLKVNFGSNHSDAEEQGAAAFKDVTRAQVTVRMLK